MTKRSEREPAEARPGKMGPLARLPVFYALEGKRCVLVGNGQAVDWKLELLEAAGAQVQRYAVDGWTPGDLRGAAMAVGGFEGDVAAKEFCDAARAQGVPVNVIDKPAFCDFSFGAIVNRSPLVIGISTDGAAPVFAQAIRAKLEALLPKGFKGEPYRSTDGAIFACAEGQGTTIIDGKPFEWGVNDVFVIPPWKRYSHNVTGNDAVLFSISDRPAQEALGIWREGN